MKTPLYYYHCYLRDEYKPFTSFFGKRIYLPDSLVATQSIMARFLDCSPSKLKRLEADGKPVVIDQYLVYKHTYTSLIMYRLNKF